MNKQVIYIAAGIKQVWPVLLKLIILFTAIQSCQKELSCEDCAVTNKAPVSFAGNDTSFISLHENYRLDGSKSYDPDGQIVEWQWTKISGPASFSFPHIDTSVVPLKKLTPGIYQFQLLVKDNNGLSDKDTIQITVVTNKAPVSIAGNDTSFSSLHENYRLDGSKSYDPDGQIVEWQWTTISGPASFSFPVINTSVVPLKKLTPGIYQFQLLVKDNDGLSDKDTIQITVTAIAQNNRPPVAHAGPDQLVISPFCPVVLDGSRSSDPDNNIVSYSWTKIAGPSSCNIVSNKNVKTRIENLDAGVYLFELKVTDSGGLFSLDTVSLEIKTTVAAGADVLFFLRDITGSLDDANLTAIENFVPRIVLAKIKIGNCTLEIEGCYSMRYSPICPVNSNYIEPTAFAVFNLPPGTYTWTAESIPTDLSTYPVPAGFKQYWSAPHNASGTIVILPGETCVIKEVVF